MIGGIGLVMIRLHIRDIGELGRGQQLWGGHWGKRWMLADRMCADGLPSDHPGDASIKAIIGGLLVVSPRRCRTDDEILIPRSR